MRCGCLVSCCVLGGGLLGLAGGALRCVIANAVHFFGPLGLGVPSCYRNGVQCLCCWSRNLAGWHLYLACIVRVNVIPWHAFALLRGAGHLTS